MTVLTWAARGGTPSPGDTNGFQGATSVWVMVAVAVLVVLAVVYLVRSRKR